MTEAELVAMSALGGVLIGSIGGVVATIVTYRQARDAREAEERRATWRLGVEISGSSWDRVGGNGCLSVL